MILPPGRKSKHPAAGPKGGFELIFHIAVCSPDSVLRSRVERQCLDYYARRDDACIVEQLDGPEALLARDDAGERYELYLIELPSTAAAASLRAAAALRSRGRRTPMAFLAHTPAHAYSAYRVDAMQYLLLPVPPEQLMALLARATEPEYGPAIPVATASGLRVLPFADIEYLECTHHVVISTSPAARMCPPSRFGSPSRRWPSRCWRTSASSSSTAPMWSIWRQSPSWQRASSGCRAAHGSLSPADGSLRPGRRCGIIWKSSFNKQQWGGPE